MSGSDLFSALLPKSRSKIRQRDLGRAPLRCVKIILQAHDSLTPIDSHVESIEGEFYGLPLPALAQASQMQSKRSCRTCGVASSPRNCSSRVIAIKLLPVALQKILESFSGPDRHSSKLDTNHCSVDALGAIA